MDVISDEPDNPLGLMSHPSVTSAVFTAGIVVHPGTESINVYKNGSAINMTLTVTMPFICPGHIHPQDCHLTVQAIQQPDHNGQVVISQCQLSIEPSTKLQTQSLLILPVSDFVQSFANDSVVQLVVTSYGDAWWHGYHLPNITIKVILEIIHFFD